jgi:predicted Zn-ribbon and HTH transcriptional regulator
MNELLKDNNIDIMIKDIIDIFHLEGVELVRVSGLVKRERKMANMPDMPQYLMETIINKLKDSGIINYKFITICPHCNEISYQIKDIDINKPKLCDTCKIMYSLIDGISIKRKV